ncbi:MAG: peptidylprolyl isomerase [Anaerolineaceae bacterium]|jgi:cyclophilin family peptidyl-prolyl cis-trans isomerase
MTQKQWNKAPDFTLDLKKKYTATFKTDLGEIVVELFADKVPSTVNNLVFLAREGYYDNTIFHRVIKDFMAQGGDPTGTGRGGPGYSFRDEFVPSLRHDKPGILSMANSGPNTNGSQFFLTTVPTPWLDGKHSVFGQVVKGLDVLLSIPPRDPMLIGAPAVHLKTIEIIEEE